LTINSVMEIHYHILSRNRLLFTMGDQLQCSLWVTNFTWNCHCSLSSICV